MASDTVSRAVLARLQRIADSGLSPGSDRNMMLKPSDAQAILAALSRPSQITVNPTPKVPKVMLRMVCSTCGSEDVLCDAFAEWDYDKQEWSLQNTFDKGSYCNACDGECRIDTIEEIKGDDDVQTAESIPPG